MFMFENLDEIEEVVKQCNKCGLCANRTKTVFGGGNVNADIMFIGEGPGGDEDIQGLPFVGKAGILMNQAFIGLGISTLQRFPWDTFRRFMALARDACV